MGVRAAIIVSCSKHEAELVRQESARERRSMSGHVLNIVTRWLSVEERVRAERRLKLHFPEYTREPGPRTTFLLRCSREEAAPIKSAAGIREWTTSAFIIHVLRQSWMASHLISRQFPPRQKQGHES